MNSKLYVGNMSFNTNEEALRAAFSQFGTLTDVYIANDRETGRPRGFAFVTFSTAEEAKVAIEKMNGVDLDGRQLTVNEARPKESSARTVAPAPSRPAATAVTDPSKGSPRLISGGVPIGHPAFFVSISYAYSRAF